MGEQADRAIIAGSRVRRLARFLFLFLFEGKVHKKCVCVVVVEIIKVYPSTMERFSATIGYAAPTPNHVRK